MNVNEMTIEVETETPDRVNGRVDDIRRTLLVCNDRLEAAYALCPEFRAEEALCLAIHRNLVNMADTLTIIRFISTVISTMMDELTDSLELCVGFLESYANVGDDDDDGDDGGGGARVIGVEEAEDITNKLAFINKLLHLNQHSFSIRLLIECSEHKRVGDKHGHDHYAPSDALMPMDIRNANASLHRGDVDAGVGVARTDTTAAAEAEAATASSSVVVIGRKDVVVRNSHHSQYAYAPLVPPPSFSRASREAEWADAAAQLKRKENEQPGVPVVLFITGPAGVGKRSYARMVAQRMHTMLEYHCEFDCRPYRPAATTTTTTATNNSSGGWSSVVPDAETIMRSLMSELQIAGLTSHEVHRAFQTLMWKAKGIMLLSNVQSYEQIAKLVPLRGRCALIVTSTVSLPKLFNVSNICLIHQRLSRLSPEQSRAVLGHLGVAKADDDSGGGDDDGGGGANARVIAEVCDGWPLALQILVRLRQLGAFDTWTALLHRFTGPIDDNEHSFLSDRPTKLHSSRSMQRVLYLAYTLLSPHTRVLLAVLHVFAVAPFTVRMCSSVLETGDATVAEALHGLAQLGFLQPQVHAAQRRRVSVASRSAANANPADDTCCYAFEPVVYEFARLAYDNLSSPSSPSSDANNNSSSSSGMMVVPLARLRGNYMRYVAGRLVEWRRQMEQQTAMQRVLCWRDFDQNIAHVHAAVHLAHTAGHLVNDADTIQTLLEPHPLFTIRLSAASRADIYHAFFAVATPVHESEAARYRVAVTMKELADAYAQSCYYEKAIPCYHEVHTHALAMRSEVWKVRLLSTALRGLATSSEMLAHYDDATENCAQCRVELEREGASVSLCSLLLYQANLYKRMGSLDESTRACDECIDLCHTLLGVSPEELYPSTPQKQRSDSEHRKHRVTPSISIAMSEWSPFPSALVADDDHSNRFLRAASSHARAAAVLSEADRGALTKLLAQVLFSAGDTYIRRHLVDAALMKLKAARTLAEKCDDAKTFALCLRGLERVHDELGQYYKAHCYRERLDQLIKQTELPLF